MRQSVKMDGVNCYSNHQEQVYYKYFEEVVSNFQIDVAKLDMNYPNNFLDSLCRKYNIKHLDLLSDFTNTENDLFLILTSI